MPMTIAETKFRQFSSIHHRLGNFVWRLLCHCVLVDGNALNTLYKEKPTHCKETAISLLIV